jgi:hypothetical protein
MEVGRQRGSSSSSRRSGSGKQQQQLGMGSKRCWSVWRLQQWCFTPRSCRWLSRSCCEVDAAQHWRLLADACTQ